MTDGHTINNVFLFRRYVKKRQGRFHPRTKYCEIKSFDEYLEFKMNCDINKLFEDDLDILSHQCDIKVFVNKC